MILDLNEREVKALEFALKADLETINRDIEEFVGEDELLLSILSKIEVLKDQV